MIWGKEERGESGSKNIWVRGMLIKTWNKLKDKVSPNVSPLVFFQYHPMFKMARRVGNFDNWVHRGVDRFCNLGSVGSVCANEIFMAKLGTCRGSIFQCNQVLGLVNKLTYLYAIFHPLTEFESMLLLQKKKMIQGQLSKVYTILMFSMEAQNQDYIGRLT